MQPIRSSVSSKLGKNHECSLSNSTNQQFHFFFYLTKFKLFADNTLIVEKIMIPVFDGVENIVGKGEDADYQHFLLFPQCF